VQIQRKFRQRIKTVHFAGAVHRTHGDTVSNICEGVRALPYCPGPIRGTAREGPFKSHEWVLSVLAHRRTLGIL
jgi:hypothetical protein